MKKILAAFCIALLSLPVPAQAAKSCYSKDEKQAEKLLRLHSELMVITVTCKQASTGRDLVRAYTGFTQQHLKVLHNAEATLIEHYKQTRGGAGTAHLDKLRTKMANDVGQAIADMSAPVFCGQRRDYVIEMAEANMPSVEDYASKAYASALSYEPSCDRTADADVTPVKARKKRAS